MLYHVFLPLDASAWTFQSVFPLFLFFLIIFGISHLTVKFHTARAVHTSRFPPSHLTVAASLFACFFLASLLPLMFHLYSLHAISTLPLLLYSHTLRIWTLIIFQYLSNYNFIKFILHLFLIYFAFIWFSHLFSASSWILVFFRIFSIIIALDNFCTSVALHLYFNSTSVALRYVSEDFCIQLSQYKILAYSWSYMMILLYSSISTSIYSYTSRNVLKQANVLCCLGHQWNRMCQ